MPSDVAYILKTSEGGPNQLEYDVKNHWRPLGFYNTISENVYAGRKRT